MAARHRLTKFGTTALGGGAGVYQLLKYVVVASVDVDAVARNMDFVTLQDNVMNITFCNIESELVCLSVTYCLSISSLTFFAVCYSQFPHLFNVTFLSV